MSYIKRVRLSVATACVLAGLTTTVTDAFGADEPGPDSLTEIVVTAEHRTESLRDAPLAVTAVAPETIIQLHLDNLQDLQFAVTDLVFSQGISYSLPSIRGVGSWLTNPGLEPAVATYIDGAYVERSFGSMLDVVDPASVQVLKGPQGTLWGRNATGGAIIIDSADPEFVFSTRASLETGSLDHQKFDLMVNTPINDTLAVRLALRYRQDGGYVRNDFNGQELGGEKVYTGRIKLAYKPNEAFSAVLEYQYDKNDRSQDPNTEVLPAAFCAFCAGSAYSYPTTNPYTTVGNQLDAPGGLDNVNFGNLKLNYALTGVNLSSITAFRNSSNFAAQDLDYTEVGGFNIFQHSGAATFTENILATTDFKGIINGAVGFDYLHDKSYEQLWVGGDPNFSGPPNPNNTVATRSYSGFAEARITPVTALTVTVGGRYTKDTREFFGTDVSFSSFTPRGVIAYDLGPANLYISYNKGFKAGGFNVPSSTVSVFQPEKIDSYEFGAKYVSEDRKARANLAIFHYKYKDIQVLGINQANVGQIGTENNAGSATGNGAELEGEYQPVRALRLFAGLAYLDAHFDTFEGAQVQVPVYNAAGAPTGFAVGTEDLSNSPLPRAPRWTGSLGATVKFPLISGWSGEITGAARYVDSFYFQAGAGGPLRADAQPAYTTAQITGRVMPAGEHFEVNFYVDNATDRIYDNFRFSTAPFGSLRDVARPRNYGIGVTMKY